MTKGTRDVKWLRQLLRDMDAPPTGPTALYVDNSGAVFLSQEPVISEKSRHVSVSMLYVREQQNEAKIIKVIHQPAAGQVADFLTKSLHGPELRENIRMVG